MPCPLPQVSPCLCLQRPHVCFPVCSQPPCLHLGPLRMWRALPDQAGGPGSLQPASCSLQVAACMPPLRSLHDSPSSGKAPAPDSPVPTCAPLECPPPPGKANHGVWAGGRTSPVYSPLPLPLGIAGTGVPERMRPGLWIMVLLLPPNPRTPHAAQPQPFPGSAGQSASVACGFFWNHHTNTPFPLIPRHQVNQRGLR